MEETPIGHQAEFVVVDVVVVELTFAPFRFAHARRRRHRRDVISSQLSSADQSPPTNIDHQSRPRRFRVHGGVTEARSTRRRPGAAAAGGGGARSHAGRRRRRVVGVYVAQHANQRTDCDRSGCRPTHRAGC